MDREEKDAPPFRHPFAVRPSLLVPGVFVRRLGLRSEPRFLQLATYEHIVPPSGNLLLTFTDLVSPGSAGFDLRIQRTYNSKIYRSFSTQGDLLDEDSWAGIGWTMHLGRVLNPEPLGPGPVIGMPDGRRSATP